MTSKAATATSTTIYFANMTPERITSTLRDTAHRIGADLEKFGAMLIEAYELEVWDELDFATWAAYCEDVLSGFTPDTATRTFLIRLMRAAGMPNKDTASAVGATERTVERANAKSGTANPRKSASAKKSATARGATGDGKTKTHAQVKASTMPPVPATPAARATAAVKALSATVRDFTDEQLAGAQAMIAAEIERRKTTPEVLDGVTDGSVHVPAQRRVHVPTQRARKLSLAK